jgi:hypothetical protein
MPQLQLNQGPQDALLFDNTKSYFTNVGYQRTSNFQMELRDVDAQNSANFGQTVSFIIPKAADLLGPIDLMIDFNQVPIPSTTGALAAGMPAGQAQMWGWVDNVGYAMIEKITFSIGSHDVETLTGESLNIINELMRSGSSRYGFHQTLKTGRPLFKQELDGGTSTPTPYSHVNFDKDPTYNSYDRIISYVHKHEPKSLALGQNLHHSTWWDSLERPGTLYPHESDNHMESGDLDVGAKDGKHLCIPLGLFFTAHPSKYFPIAAIAGCNDIRVSIKFRQVAEVIMQKGTFKQNSSVFSAFGVGPYIEGSLALVPADVAKALALTTSANLFTTQPRHLVITQAAGSATTAAVAIGLANAAIWECTTECVFDTTAKFRITALKQIQPGKGFRVTEVELTSTAGVLAAAVVGAITYAFYSGDRTLTSTTSTYYGAVIASTAYPAAWDVASTAGTSYAAGTGIRYVRNYGSGALTNSVPMNDASTHPKPTNGNWFNKCQLRCHYIHVTGPEATALMNREHVRLMKLMDDTNHLTKQFRVKCSSLGNAQTLSMDLNFLHPVQEIVITIRKVSEMGSGITNTLAPGFPENGEILALETTGNKNYFAYHGGGRDPNFENWTNFVDSSDSIHKVRQPTCLLTTNFQLKLNGQSRHLDGAGIDRDYLLNRLMPMIHSAAREDYMQVSQHSELEELRTLSELFDRKEIYVYPFALNPEGANPSGSVNFSKVSHARLEIGVEGIAPGMPSAADTCEDDYIVDVYGVYYNWLAIKDGRALTSFA